MNAATVLLASAVVAASSTLLVACAAGTSAYVAVEDVAKATGLTIGSSITGNVDCRDGGLVRNDVPVGQRAAIEYEISPPTRCVQIDLVDASGKVLSNWTDVAWCNNRVKGAVLTGDGRSFIRAIADSCAGTTLTLRLVAAPPT